MSDDRGDDARAPEGEARASGDDELSARHGGTRPVLRELPPRPVADRRFRLHVLATMVSVVVLGVAVSLLSGPIVAALPSSVPVVLPVVVLVVLLAAVLIGVDAAFRTRRNAISRGLSQMIPAVCGSFLGGLVSGALPVPGLLVVVGLALGASFGVGMTRGR